MKLKEIVDILEASVLAGDERLDNDFSTGGASDLMSDILAGVAEGCVLLTGLTTVQAIRTAVVCGAGAVVFVRDKIPPPEVVEMARDENIPLLTTPFSMFVSCGRLHAGGLTGLNGAK